MRRVSQKLGDFGRYQFFIYVLALIVGLISGIQVNNFIWLGYVPKVRCRLANTDEFLARYDAGFNQEIVQQQLGLFSDVLNGYCNYCPSNTVAPRVYNECTSDVWQKCDGGFVYDRSFIDSSLGMQYDMACDGAYKLNLAKSATMVGMLLGAVTFGTLADRFGRRVTTLVGLTGHILFYFGSVFLFRISYPVMLIVQMMTLAFSYGSYMITYTVFMELAGGVYRTALGVMFQGAFTLGSLYLALVVFFFRDWIWILLVSGAPFVFIAPYFWIFPESIRFAITTGDVEVAVKMLNRAAKMNKVSINAEQLVFEERKASAAPNFGDKASVVDLLCKDVQLAKATLINFFTWMAVSMLYFGLALNTTDFPGHPLVSFSLLAIADLPGLLLCIPSMEHFGRRPTLVLFMGFAGVCVIATTLPLPKWCVLAVAVLGKLFAAGAFSVVYNYSVEMFPTVARATGLGWGSSSGRVGSILAPLVRNLGYYVASWLPFVIYGGIGLIAAFLNVFLPETKDRELPETIEDGKHFVRNEPLERDTDEGD